MCLLPPDANGGTLADWQINILFFDRLEVKMLPVVVNHMSSLYSTACEGIFLVVHLRFSWWCCCSCEVFCCCLLERDTMASSVVSCCLSMLWIKNIDYRNNRNQMKAIRTVQVTNIECRPCLWSWAEECFYLFLFVYLDFRALKRYCTISWHKLILPLSLIIE